MIATLLPLAQARDGGSGITTLILLVLLGAFFYFLLIRPQQRRVRQQRELMASLQVGDEVVTVGGLFGRIRSLDDERAVLEVAPGVELVFSRAAIARRVPRAEEFGPQEEEEAGEQP